MRKALSIALMLVVALSGTALAKAADQAGQLEKLQFMDLSQPKGDQVTTSNPGVFGAALAGTTYFGGTVWDATDNRWEAQLGGTWTFNSGVGSSFDHSIPGVNPYKNSLLHATMEGWIGIDNTFSELTYFRRLQASDFPSTACVGSAAGLGGNYSFWCGVLPSEADDLCFAAGQGYGNNWFICIGKTFSYNGIGSVTLAYNFLSATEDGYDFAVVNIDTTGTGAEADVEVVAYDGVNNAQPASHALTKGVDLRSDAGDIVIKFCVSSDGAYSDQDGLYPTVCGGFAVDDVSVNGGGITDFSDFESGANGWQLLPAVEGLGGEWSDLAEISTLGAIKDPCGCNMSDSVLVFRDLTASGGHGLYQDNIAASPWIDLLQYGMNGAPGKFVEFHGYFELPLVNYIFVQINTQWYPEVCQATGTIITSEFTSDGYVYYFGGVPTCRDDVDPVRTEFSTIANVNAEQMRVALGMLNYCRFYGGACTGVTNSTPWFDNVRLGVYGNPDAPYVSASEVDYPQDSFPENGTIRFDAKGRVDSNNVKGYSTPEPYSSQGDTLIANGGSGGGEVWVEFGIKAGPGTDTGVLATRLAYATSLPSKGDGLNWYEARMDTAEQGGTVVANTWMTAYHESNPGGRPAASDTDRDSNDLDALGQANRLTNDIFPDDVLTPGSRINLFYKTRFVGSMTWFTSPDTTDGTYYEMEVLPSSMAADSTYNCVLYVDHFDGRGAQNFIESGLGTFLTGGSANYENTAWDRWDVRASSSSQGSFGRPANTEYGATLIQTLGYKAILWNSGNLQGSQLVKEDAEVLIPWLTLTETGLGFNNLYLSGDGLAQSMATDTGEGTAPSTLLSQWCGVSYTCGTVRDAACGVSAIEDTTSCINLDPVAGARAASGSRTVDHVGQGNGCPQFRSFDLLNTFAGAAGTPLGDEQYVGGVKTENYASVTNLASGGPDYRTVVDGLSVHYRRDTSEPCLFTTSTWPDEPAVAERLNEVLTYFGYAGSQSCSDPTSGTGVGDDLGRTKTFKTALANFAPNPLMSGAKGSLQFTMAREGKASVDIFDVNGRLIRTVFSGVAPEGVNVIHWDGTDANQRPVASGVYFYRLRANGDDLAKKLVVVRNGN